MNKLLTSFIAFLGIAAFFTIVSGCSGTTSRQSENLENSAAFDSVKVPSYSGETEVVMTHTVKDYQEWLKSYTANSDPKARVSIFTSTENPNLITIYELTKSHEDARNSFNSAEQKKAREDAGVSSTPMITYYDIKYLSTDESKMKYRLGVSHVVADYDKWKKGFDQDEPVREKAGLELRSIATDADKPGVVHVIFATDDVEKAKDVITNEDIKKRMKEAGVISGPELIVLTVPN